MSFSHLIKQPALILLFFLTFPVMALEAPSGANVFTPFKSVEPVTNTSAMNSQPIGLGNVANNGDSFSLKVKLSAFANPVDLYLALFVPELDPINIYLVTEPLGLQPHSVGFMPWKSNTLAVNEALFGDIPIALLPQSRYSVILLAVPAGTPVPKLTENFYLWSSSFSTLDLISLSNQAVTQLGGGAEAATAILLALDRGNSLDTIIHAILMNTLTESGEIIETRSVLQKNAQNRPKICETFAGLTICTENIKLIYTKITEGLNNGNISKDELETLVTAITLLASNKGYSSVQIYDAIKEMVEKGTINIDKNGNIWENCTNILCDNGDRIKVEKDALTALEEMLTVLENEDDPSPDYGLNDIIEKVCAPFDSSADTNKNLFDFVTCSETNVVNEVPNFQYNFSRINQAQFQVRVNATFSYAIPNSPFPDSGLHQFNYVNNNIGEIVGLKNNFNFKYIDTSYMNTESITISLNSTGDAVSSVSAISTDKNNIGTVEEYVSWKTKITLSGEVPLTFFKEGSRSYFQYELKGPGVCNLVTNFSDEMFLNPANSNGGVNRSVETIECDDNSWIHIRMNEK